jgi:hypothetical protein
MPNLFDQPDIVGVPTEEQVPAYLLAADNHNLGNTRGGSWLDPETWGDKFSNGGKLIATGVLSGANSFYNTGVAIGNWFGAEAEQNDTRSWISSIDSDLGSYYDKNRQAADLVGFIATSILPGLGGIKVLNAGQTALKAASKTGFIGENLSRATGLLVPQTERYITLAAADINAAQATFSAINANGVKALAAGVWQNVLEGAAFETAVQATMFKSPILEQQDGWDIVKNIAIGGAFQGVLGGAFAAASSLGQIRKEVKIFEAAGKWASAREIPAEGLSPAMKIILMAEDRDLALSVSVLPGATEAEKVAAHIDTTNLADKIRRIDNDMRTEYHNLTVGKDTEIGNMIADASYGLDHRATLGNLLGSDEITRLSGKLKIESEISKLVKEKLPTDGLMVKYVKLTGEDAGTVMESAPVLRNLADVVAPRAGESTQEAVLSEVKSYKFKPGQNWAVNDLRGSNAHLEAEARYIWADKVMKEIKPGTSVNQYDIPVLERAYKDGVTDIKLIDSKNKILKDKFVSREELWNHIVQAKTDAAGDLLAVRAFKAGVEQDVAMPAISKMVNTKTARLEGTNVGRDLDDFLAHQTASKEYAEQILSKGLTKLAHPEGDVRFLPSWAKIAKRSAGLEDVDGHIIDGMTYIKTQQKLLQDGINNVVAKFVGDMGVLIPEITDSQLMTANRYGAGAGLTSFSNGGYGSLESLLQASGAAVNKIKTAFRAESEGAMNGELYNLARNQKAAIEWSTINQKVSRSGELWIRHTEGVGDEAEHFLITKKAAAKYLKEGELDFDSLNSELPEHLINLNNRETVAMVDSHIGRTGTRTQAYNELRVAQGGGDTLHAAGKDISVFRPIRANPKDYPFFAFVKDIRVGGQGDTTMIFAASESKLQEMINKVPPQFKTFTKRDSEDWHRAYADYEYSKTLSESYINSELKNSGVYSDFFTKTDPQKIVNDIMQQHLREDDALAVNLVRAKNSRAFAFLEDQGDAYTKISASKFGSYSDRLEAAGKNPYLDYIKTGLDISKVSEHPLIYGAGKLLDGAVSKMMGEIGDVFAKAKSHEELAGIDKILSEYGMNTGFRDAATDLLANHTAPKGELTKFIRTANAILSKLTLGLDPLNALNNFIGANILRGTELKQITDAIKAGDKDLAGSLAGISKVTLPGEYGQITAPAKLIAKAFRNFMQDDGTLLQNYKAAGYIKDATTQFRQILDDFTLRGTETVPELNKRLTQAFAKAKTLSEVGEKATGNKLAEELNRFVSADVMRQITDLGVGKGLMTEAEQHAYINTFVNRVEGNTIASQRPLMFQGPIGQAIGLFQSYQFNLMQQMFRYVAEGTKKDAAMLLGLQGTMYGVQGLPAFQFINQHIVGTLSGNDKHIDLYDSIYGAAGKSMGDLITYGLPSNLLQANLYARGDINPRQLTVVPTTIPDIPFVGAFGKFLGSMKDTVTKIAGGGAVWESMLQGLEHNGLSRPLSGLAQTLQAGGPNGTVYSTTSKGTILSSNDLLSWATLTRLSGGRPLDEAIVNDGVFRIQSYAQMDHQRMLALGEIAKTTMIEGNRPVEDSVAKMTEAYAAAGGKQAQFNKFMINQFKAANTSAAEKIAAQLQNPFAQKLQVLMGGGSDTSTPSY